MLLSCRRLVGDVVDMHAMHTHKRQPSSLFCDCSQHEHISGGLGLCI